MGWTPKDAARRLGVAPAHADARRRAPRAATRTRGLIRRGKHKQFRRQTLCHKSARYGCQNLPADGGSLLEVLETSMTWLTATWPMAMAHHGMQLTIDHRDCACHFLLWIRRMRLPSLLIGSTAASIPQSPLNVSAVTGCQRAILVTSFSDQSTDFQTQIFASKICLLYTSPSPRDRG